jgi:hypothetical protein
MDGWNARPVVVWRVVTPAAPAAPTSGGARARLKSPREDRERASIRLVTEGVHVLSKLVVRSVTVKM